MKAKTENKLIPSWQPTPLPCQSAASSTVPIVTQMPWCCCSIRPSTYFSDFFTYFCTDKTRTAHKPPPPSAPSPKFELILISGPAVFTETQKWKQKLEMGDTFSIPAFSSMLCRHRLQHKASIMIMLQLESILDPGTPLCCQLLFHSKAATYLRGEDKVWK